MVCVCGVTRKRSKTRQRKDDDHYIWWAWCDGDSVRLSVKSSVVVAKRWMLGRCSMIPMNSRFPVFKRGNVEWPLDDRPRGSNALCCPHLTYSRCKAIALGWIADEHVGNTLKRLNDFCVGLIANLKSQIDSQTTTSGSIDRWPMLNVKLQINRLDVNLSRAYAIEYMIRSRVLSSHDRYVAYRTIK